MPEGGRGDSSPPVAPGQAPFPPTSEQAPASFGAGQDPSLGKGAHFGVDTLPSLSVLEGALDEAKGVHAALAKEIEAGADPAAADAAMEEPMPEAPTRSAEEIAELKRKEAEEAERTAEEAAAFAAEFPLETRPAAEEEPPSRPAVHAPSMRSGRPSRDALTPQ